MSKINQPDKSNKITKSIKPFPYTLIKKVGSGAFGDVYKAQHIDKTKKILVAVKCENIEENSKKSLLYDEYLFYKRLNTNKTHIGIPTVYYFGLALISEPNNKIVEKNVMVIDYLGPNLYKLFHAKEKKFSLKTILMIAIQCLDRIHFIHNNGIIHRDIKPDNFLIGTTRSNVGTIFLVDFGLSKTYIDYTNYSMNKLVNTHSFTGTYNFCSMRNHKCIEQSRRDDLESLGYMILYFFKGNLPWQNIQEENRETRSELIFEKKKNTTIEELCSNAPKIMIEYITYCRLLRYTDVPNYEMLKNLFISELERNNMELDNIFDWFNLVKD